jgi:RNA polymerase sigma-70 factor, ECF subfamily
MDTPSATPTADDERRLRLALQGDGTAWSELLARHRNRLRRMIALRLDRRLRGRIDPSDVIQEAYLDAARRLGDYARDPDPMPPFLWLRFLASQRLQEVHRRHLGAKGRDAAREIALEGVPMPAATSAALAAQLLGRDTSASEAALRAERKLRLMDSLEAMDPIDREILALRHLEELTNAEAARTLGLSEAAASKRYIRALRRLKYTLRGLPGGSTEFRP